MRIVAGKYARRRLGGPRGLVRRGGRPTSDKLRETLFNILGRTVEGSTFVDVYAGTGAVGIEALSRGAREAIFIESDPAAVALIQANLRSLGIQSGENILAVDAVRGLEILTARHRRADFFFLDPPYAESEEYERALGFLDRSRLLVPTGRVIVEHARRRVLPARWTTLEHTRTVEQGDAALTFYRLALAA